MCSSSICSTGRSVARSTTRLRWTSRSALRTRRRPAVAGTRWAHLLATEALSIPVYPEVDHRDAGCGGGGNGRVSERAFMRVILYDGECGFCAASIRFVWRRDRHACFHFAAIQSGPGRELLREHGVADPQLDTVILLDGELLYRRSEAVLRVCCELPRYRLVSRLALLIPRSWRDWIYDRIAERRHRLDRGEKCELPPPEVRKRFLDVD